MTDGEAKEPGCLGSRGGCKEIGERSLCAFKAADTTKQGLWCLRVRKVWEHRHLPQHIIAAQQVPAERRHESLKYVGPGEARWVPFSRPEEQVSSNGAGCNCLLSFLNPFWEEGQQVQVRESPPKFYDRPSGRQLPQREKVSPEELL